MAEPRFSDKCRVSVSDDNMTATLFIEPPSNGIAYSVDELTSFVKAKGVYGGIIFSAIDYMTKENIYYTDYVIARGTEPTEGSEGYFEMFFNYQKKRTPEIRPDGSVDYQSMSEINMVEAGDTLMVYHRPVQGTHGVDVRGRTLRAKPCKELPVIKGTGFSYDEVSCTYTADKSGKIEYDGRTLRISEIYEFRGDLDLVTGKIDFKGDVIIKGNVLTGTYIRATKSITVEGSVEAATLIAGTDVILKKGMQGGNRARISCGGDVFAQFIEFTTVEAKGRVEANVIMNSSIRAGSEVVVSGKRGAIIGGTVYAIGTIQTNYIGNAAGHKTAVSVGIPRKVQERYKTLKNRLYVFETEVEKLQKEIIIASDPRTADADRDVRAARITQLNRRLARSTTNVSKIEKELATLDEMIGMAENACIKVAGITFEGTGIAVDELKVTLEKKFSNVIFKKDEFGTSIDVVEGTQ